VNNDEFLEAMKRAIAAIDQIPQSKYMIVSARALDRVLRVVPRPKYKAKKSWQRGSR
jgi:hypothetical protein